MMKLLDWLSFLTLKFESNKVSLKKVTTGVNRTIGELGYEWTTDKLHRYRVRTTATAQTVLGLGNYICRKIKTNQNFRRSRCRPWQRRISISPVLTSSSHN